MCELWGDWELIAVSQRRIYMEDGVMNHDLLSPYGTYEILTGGNHAQGKPRLKLRIAPAGKGAICDVEHLDADDRWGRRGEIQGGATQSMQRNGAIEIPRPTYGYFRGSQVTHERMGRCLYSVWIQQDLDELIYVDRLESSRSGGGDLRVKQEALPVGITCSVREET